MKTKIPLNILMVWGFLLGGMAQAQQGKALGEKAEPGQSQSAYGSYTVGKEHYLPGSPYYMAGKEHYLRSGASSKEEKTVQGNEQNVSSKDEMGSEDREMSEGQGGAQLHVEIYTNPDDTNDQYGVIYLPVIRPKHHRGSISPPPNAPQTGSPNPNVSGRMVRGTRNFR